MLYHLLYPLRDAFSGFNVFRYITFRSAGAVLTALIVSFLLGPSMIAWLRRLKVGQQVRVDGPQTHLTKQGTPTMGGLLIIASLATSVLLWSDLTNKYVWVVLFATLAFGGIGFWDDYLKVVKKHSTGLRAFQKFGLQIAASLAIGIFLYKFSGDHEATFLSVPFMKSLLLDLGWFYVPFVAVVIVGSSNAVNLTDGLDGLAIGLVGIAATANAVIVYLGGNKIIADYLKILYISGSGELAIFCGAMLGASLGFLWYNTHPAEVFMGDVGSLSLGGALGTLAVVTKHELILIIVGVANLVGYIMAVERIPVMVAELFLSITTNKWVMLLLINILLLTVGCFIDGASALIIFTPVLLPLIYKLGIDPIYFGVVITVNLMIGTITPPVGLCLYVACGIADVRLEQISRSIIPFLLVEVAVLFLITYVPELIMFIPNMFAPR